MNVNKVLQEVTMKQCALRCNLKQFLFSLLTPQCRVHAARFLFNGVLIAVVNDSNFESTWNRFS